MDKEIMNNEFYKSLPEEVKETLKSCKSEEEAMDILKQDMVSIPDETLKVIAGGDCWDHCATFGQKCSDYNAPHRHY